jgi:hypothetical protein
MSAQPEDDLRVVLAGKSDSCFALQHRGRIVAHFYWSPPFALDDREIVGAWRAGDPIGAGWWWYDTLDPSTHYQSATRWSVIRPPLSARSYVG